MDESLCLPPGCKARRDGSGRRSWLPGVSRGQSHGDGESADARDAKDRPHHRFEEDADGVNDPEPHQDLRHGKEGQERRKDDVEPQPEPCEGRFKGCFGIGTHATVAHQSLRRLPRTTERRVGKRRLPSHAFSSSKRDWAVGLRGGGSIAVPSSLHLYGRSKRRYVRKAEVRKLAPDGGISVVLGSRIRPGSCGPGRVG